MKQIFINLPVQDLEQSMYFYEQLGFTINPLFTDENQKCMVWSDQIYVMLQSKKFSSSYIKKPIANLNEQLASTFTLPVDSDNTVNYIIERGLAAGGKEPAPMKDEGFMLLRSIEDPDGHIWGIIHLDMDKFNEFKKNSLSQNM